MGVERRTTIWRKVKQGKIAILRGAKDKPYFLPEGYMIQKYTLEKI